MKIELIEKTEKLTGRKIYSVNADGQYVNDTVAFDITKAREIYQKCIEMASRFPNNTEEVIATCTVVNVKPE